MQGVEPGHQRGHMAAAKPGRGGDTQVPAGLHTTRADAGFGVGELSQQALAVFQERAALVGEGDAPGGAHQQLHAQPFFQRINAPAHDGGGHTFGLGSGGQAAPGGDRDEGFELFKFGHAGVLTPPRG